jgi:hypothetical protein
VIRPNRLMESPVIRVLSFCAGMYVFMVTVLFCQAVIALISPEIIGGQMPWSGARALQPSYRQMMAKEYSRAKCFAL